MSKRNRLDKFERGNAGKKLSGRKARAQPQKGEGGAPECKVRKWWEELGRMYTNVQRPSRSVCSLAKELETRRHALATWLQGGEGGLFCRGGQPSVVVRVAKDLRRACLRILDNQHARLCAASTSC